MIVAIGIDGDHTFARFVERTKSINIPVKVLNLRDFVDGDWCFEVPAREPAQLHNGNQLIELSPDDAFYCRMIDLSSHEPDAARAKRWRALLSGLRAWLETIPGRVVNPARGGEHNSSKPLHEAVLQGMGFAIPDSITTCDVEAVRRFIDDGPTISKTVCGVRADAISVTEADFVGFEPASGPVHLQRQVSGADARIHVIGSHVIAQRVDADTADYRREGRFDDLKVFEPPSALCSLLVRATRELGLEFAGWDFKIDANEVYWCLEANPMPGYSPYDSRCDGAITTHLLRHLGADVPAP
ncbi:MAG: hypothetical protein WCC64_14900 [Aliidongia sp.]